MPNEREVNLNELREKIQLISEGGELIKPDWVYCPIEPLIKAIADYADRKVADYRAALTAASDVETAERITGNLISYCRVPPTLLELDILTGKIAAALTAAGGDAEARVKALEGAAGDAKVAEALWGELMFYPADYATNGIPPEDEEAISAIAIALRTARLRNYPRIVCLCGSTRFMKNFHEAGWRFTLAGKIVLSVGVCKHADDHGAEVLGDGVAERLDELHLRKIDLADEVFILNVGGYIGESTQREIQYATEKGKPIKFLEPIDADALAALLAGEGKGEEVESGE
jgi:hypothetical protein